MVPSVWLLWLLLITVYDLRQRRVPNWLALAGAVGALVVLMVGAQPFGVGWSDAAIAMALGFGVLLLFYALRLLGAGDVKFAAALGLWIGTQALLQVWIVASLLAALHSLLWWLLRDLPVWPWVRQLIYSPAGRKATEQLGEKPRPIPYAAYLAIAAMTWAAWR